MEALVLRTLVSLLVVGISSVAIAAPKPPPAVDILGNQQVSVSGPNANAALDRSINDLKGIFQKYEVVVDSGTSITSPLEITGSQNLPVLQVSMKKCVIFVCEEVDFNGEVSLKELPGSAKCARNLQISIDLSRSGATLTKNYSSIEMSICFNADAKGAGKADIAAVAKRAAGFRKDIIQSNILQLLVLQVKPMTVAFSQSLAKNAAK
jgi:hypothetical protein